MQTVRNLSLFMSLLIFGYKDTDIAGIMQKPYQSFFSGMAIKDGTVALYKMCQDV